MIDYSKLLSLLCEQKVEFVLIGGVAAVLHGSGRLTQDLDIVYSRNFENLVSIVDALRDQSPYLRGAPAGLPFEWSVETLRSGLNFTLQTNVGAIDLFGEIPAGGRFDDLAGNSIEVELFGATVLCIGLEKLIETKRAAGRPKDLETLAELEAILEEKGE